MKKYSYLPGALLLVAAVSRAALQVRWDRTGLFLAVGGALIMALGVAANWRNVREWFADPQGVFAVNTTLSGFLLVAILGLLNALAAFRPVQIDLTASGRNTLTAETRSILAGLKEPIVLAQFGRAHDPRVDLLLGSFAAASRRVGVEFVDAERTPRDAQTYGVVRGGTVVVRRGDKFRKVEQPTEPGLATAILQVTSPTEPVVCVAGGDGEHAVADQGSGGLSLLAASLAASNFRVEEASLLEGDVPRACAVLLMAGPRVDLPPAVLARLAGYVDRGGRVALLVDPPVPASLAAWLKPFGLQVGSGVIIDASAAQAVGAGPDVPLAAAYADHPITRNFGIATLFPNATAISVGPADVGRPVPLARTSPRAFERVDLTSRSTEFREGRDRPGPITLGAAWTLAVPPGTGASAPITREARLVVFGDSDFLTNAFLGRGGNRDLALRTIAWLSGEEEARIVSISDRENRRIELTERTRLLMYLVNLIALPLLPVLAGLIYFARTRRQRGA